jgi:hypothetical protein
MFLLLLHQVVFDFMFMVPARADWGQKKLRGNRFYKGHKDIAEKASHHFRNASIPLKMH